GLRRFRAARRQSVPQALSLAARPRHPAARHRALRTGLGHLAAAPECRARRHGRSQARHGGGSPGDAPAHRAAPSTAGGRMSRPLRTRESFLLLLPAVLLLAIVVGAPIVRVLWLSFVRMDLSLGSQATFAGLD